MMNENIRKPDATEYLAEFGKYVSLVPDGDILTILSQQIQETTSLLNSIPESRGGFRYASDKWSIKDVVGHLIDSERIFTYRALRFARNDKTPLPGYEQDDYVSNASFDSCTLADLASEFNSARQSTAYLFKHLEPDAWMRKGLANDGEATVRALAYIIAGHELHHRGVLNSRYLPAMGLSEQGAAAN